MTRKRHRLMTLCGAALALAPAFSTVIAQVIEAPPPTIRVIRIPPTEPWESYRSSFAAGPPLLRGFRFPMLDQPHDLWPVKPPGPETPEPLRRAADVVAQRLAKDRLLVTLSKVIQILGPANFTSDSQLDTLRAIGLPIDWLDYFSLDGASPGRDGIVREIARQLASGEHGGRFHDRLAATRFVFQPSRPGFRLAPESGEGPVTQVRLQSPTSDYRRGPGDGGEIDIIRQLIAAWPDSSYTLSVEEKNLSALIEKAKTWPLKRPAQLTVLAMPWPIEQWAQDNAKPGFAQIQPDGPISPALLLPRYASRGEERTVLDPNASLAVRSLTATGLTLVASPLVFQGGNLLPVRNPANGKTLLLIGEAEIYRNVALGLHRGQILEAFRVECGVDRCIDLPAVSFHLDFELSIRSHKGKLVAFVNDEVAAARIILGLGAHALVQHGVLSAETGEKARALLAGGKDGEALDLLSGPTNGLSNKDGYFRADAAQGFASDPSDSGAANLQRYLLAMDILASLAVKPEEMPKEPFTRAYIASLQRRHAARLALNQQLAELGWRVVAIPSLADEDRSINYLNGFQEAKRVVMPAWGGFYRPLDDAAASAFRTALDGDVEIVRILCSESQCRLGAIHCSASVWPRPAP